MSEPVHDIEILRRLAAREGPSLDAALDALLGDVVRAEAGGDPLVGGRTHSAPELTWRLILAAVDVAAAHARARYGA